MKNILVTGANAIIGYGILKSIGKSNNKVNLIGSSTIEDSVAQGFCDIFIKAPISKDVGYISWLVNIVHEYNVDLLIPGREEDVYIWKDNIDELKKSGAKILINNVDLISLCEDKWNFYEILKLNNCPYAISSSLSSDFDELVDEFGLPLLLKPRHGSASKGIVKVFDREIFLLHKEKIGKELMVQPLIGKDDEEFTTAAFGDGNGGYYAIINFKRDLSKDGYTEKAEVFESKEIEEAVSGICKILKPIGPTNFQFRLHNGICQLLEINPRISASTSIRSAFGYNESIMAVEYYLENKIPKQPKIRKGRAVRYIEDYIFYS